MEIVEGSCRFGLWFVQVWWKGTTVHRVRFATTGIPGEIPDLIRQYCGGKVVSLLSLNSSAVTDDTVYGRIYRMVQQIPYGSTSTYGEIAEMVGTSPRVVGRQWHTIPRRLLSRATAFWLLMESEDSPRPLRSRKHCLQWRRKGYERWRNDKTLPAAYYWRSVFLPQVFRTR